MGEMGFTEHRNQRMHKVKVEMVARKPKVSPSIQAPVTMVGELNRPQSHEGWPKRVEYSTLQCVVDGFTFGLLAGRRRRGAPRPVACVWA